jgi:4-hydroxy-tetrahydrodipicolinate reductase
MKKKVLIVGSKGKMGSAVCEVLKNDYDIICVKERENWVKFSADLIIDFGSAESSVLSAEMSFKMGVPLIIGSTGQSSEQLEKIDKLCAGVPFMVCANFSVGVVLLKSAIDNILKVKIDEIAIFEKHHREKKDTPSGTAKELQKYILKSQAKEVQMLSLRGGKEIGSHSVSFYFGEELVEVSHAAFSRKAFADGVAIAVSFMLNVSNPKKYYFDEIIKEKFGLN